MSLISGKPYLIRSKANGAYVQRALTEDKSLLPKRVISIPPEVVPEPWFIEKDGQFYVLKARGAPAFTKDGLVFVALIGEPDIDVKWKITAVPQAGANVFLIESPTKFGGWVLPESEPETQVAFRPLIIGPSEPPFYPPNQLWIITPFGDDE